MGMASGGEVFDPVAEQLQEENLPPATRRRVLTVLIRELQNLGWDTEDESLGLFREDPSIVSAFAANEVYLLCHEEHESEPWACEERINHLGDHKDYVGHTWPRTKEIEKQSSKPQYTHCCRHCGRDVQYQTGTMMSYSVWVHVGHSRHPAEPVRKKES